MVTAAAVAHANRLPLLLLSGDTFLHRIVDPVLQQIEQFDDPTITACDTLKPVTRYWDRITKPEQIVRSLPQALAVMLDPADCGPAFFALPQDVQAEAFDYPAVFFERRVHYIRRPGPDSRDIEAAAALLRGAKQPLIIAGGGVHYSGAVEALTAFAVRHAIPVVETLAGKAALVHDHPNYAGPIGVNGSPAANAMAEDADVVIAVGTRLQNFTTGSWALFKNPKLRFVSINTARWDAVKQHAAPVIGDALVSIEQLDAAIGDYAAPADWLALAQTKIGEWHAYLDTVKARPVSKVPAYGHVVQTINEICDADDYIVSAAGGLPGELVGGWRSKSVGSFDTEFGMTAALNGTRIERNTIISSRNDRKTTAPMNSGRRDDNRSLMSMNAAVCPVTKVWAFVPATVAGSTSSRNVCTKSSVFESCGDVAGIAVITAVSPASLTIGCVTNATSLVDPIAERTSSTRATPSVPSTTIVSGPLKPSPKPAANVS